MKEQTFEEILNGIPIESEKALLEINDRVFIKEPIVEIRNKTTQEAFVIFIGCQTIGCCYSDGWETGIFGNFPEIVLYIPEVMKKLQFENIAKLVEEVIHSFPEGTDFTKRDQAYCDVINFLEGHDRAIEDKQKFEKYSPAEKSQIREKYQTAVEKLENETESLWEYKSAPEGGWANIIDFLKNNLNAKIWK
jgi:hypothetical protein